ncbi:Zinc finger CCCH domain-containing protein 54 [Zea mays]|uniref:Zinc finger CCCH domain-containing protein 18 n=1 Tax=Zea mays TaxID=4577 RepID=B4FN34_MAIZE|nr:Zinc finger CCCH domain-containing protein 54 [Zea mays]ACF83527.1 unknown [Zea mays]AQL10378.1 Zinc finger CCCH domain-containing protein 18 [Zea mays]|eukprot:NP_001140295.1 uncharacterized protein LOC100272340 [Zea mays]
MDSSELHILALQRVKQVEPENASKILGCILLEEPDNQDMLQLAYGNDAEVHAKISHAKAMLDAIVACCSSSPAFGYHYWPPVPNKAQAEEYALQPQHYSGGGCYYASENALIYNGGGPPRSRLSSTRRPCHYFIKGICKNGQSCHYSHHRQEAQVCSGALEKLELEIIELLKSRHGQPLSIASLPTLYGDRYGKSLKADGYLTESKRHGKAGYSLSRLISRLSKITTIERPHGQHYVVLAEDAGRYKELMSRGERGGDMGSSSHQVYLTFPSESTFMEEDVANYFGLYGSVRDVRIPWQEKRMFGFVSFHNPETVNTILTMRIPHFIGESRVLVKRYIEKSKCIERYRPRALRRFVGMDMDMDMNDDDDDYDDQPPARMVMRNQQRLLATEKRLIELERKRFFAMPPQQYQHVYFDCSIGDDDGQGQPPPRHLPLIITQPARASSSSSYDDDDDDIQLPESPFTSSAVPMLM